MTPEQLASLIHETPTKAVLIITGGGTEVLPMLLKRGGGSATLLSACVPYANAETAALLGGEPEKYVSEQTTRQLAMAAYQKALALRTDDEPVIGVACSSALQKTPEEREGRIHHIHIALQTHTKTVSWSVTIDPKGFMQYPFLIREAEETMNALMVLNLVAEGCGLDERASITYGMSVFPPSISAASKNGFIKQERRESNIYSTYFPYSAYFPELFAGEVKALLCGPSQNILLPLTKCVPPRYLLPGSFNPAHAGHAEMAEYVERSGVGVCDYELSIRNADKPILDFITIEERLSSIKNRRVWLTNAPTFAQKAEIFPNTTFVVGYDTMIRIVNPKYGNLDEVYATFKAMGTRFVVFGREIDGVYHAGLDRIPERFAALCSEVTEPLHYRHVSSSDIRNNQSRE